MSEPIRILHVFGKMNRGGAETMIMNIYRNIDRSKIQFDFMVHTDEECIYDKEIILLGGRIFRVPRYKGTNHLLYVHAWNLFLRNKEEYRVLHGHIRSTASIYLKLAKKNGLLTIMHSHSTSSGKKGLVSKVKDIYQYPIRKIADYYLACSKDAGKWLFGDQIIENSRFKVIYNSIVVDDFIFNKKIREKTKSELNLEDNFVVGHIGRFSYPKNHDYLIDIFSEIKKRKPNSMLLLLGEGEYRKSIEEKIKKLNLSDYVIFLGVREDISDLLNVMDLILFPSLYEGLPVTLIEAQVNGLQIVASDTITSDVAITDNIHFFSLKEPPKKWSDKVFSLEGLGIRKNMSVRAKEAGYDVGLNVKKMEKFYLELHNK